MNQLLIYKEVLNHNALYPHHSPWIQPLIICWVSRNRPISFLSKILVLHFYGIFLTSKQSLCSAHCSHCLDGSCCRVSATYEFNVSPFHQIINVLISHTIYELLKLRNIFGHPVNAIAFNKWIMEYTCLQDVWTTRIVVCDQWPSKKTVESDQ